MPRCSYCRGRGELKDPFTRGAYNTCPECGGSGWLPDCEEIVEIIEIEPPKDPRIAEELRKRQREYDKYMITKFYGFFLQRPFELIATFLSSRRYGIDWKHYISGLWWGMFVVSIFLVFNIPLPPEYILISMSLIFIIFLYYVIKSKVELP